MNRRLNLTSLPDELLIKIMQGGPTTCDGIPNFQVKLTPEVKGSEPFERMLMIDIDFHLAYSADSEGNYYLLFIKSEVERDLIQAIKRGKSAKMHSHHFFGFRVMVELGQVPDAKLEAVATQAGTRFLEFIATTLEKIGKKYGLHVRDGRVKEGAATFYLCEGGKLAQASRAFHGLKS